MRSGTTLGTLDVPLGLRGELDRPDLVARLRRRWEVPLTLVVAGAGFGKSTVLAQAVRAEALAPPGIQAWVNIQPGFEQAECLVAAIAQALSLPAGDGDPLHDLVSLLGQIETDPVCLTLDDLHLIPADASSMMLLAGLIRRLPRHVHLVLSSRVTPDLPLAYLQASDQICELDESDLRFTRAEARRLAEKLHVAPPPQSMGGWPALVRLSLAIRPDAAWRYAREEVLASLSEADRESLLILAGVSPLARS